MRIVRLVLRTELLQLVRDKRALFSAIVLPALLYPIFFWGSTKLEEVGESRMKSRDLTVLVDLTGADEGLEARLAEVIPTEAGATELQEIDAGPVLGAEGDEAERLAARELLGVDAAEDAARSDLLVIAERVEGPGERVAFELWYDVKSDDGREAHGRIRTALRALEDEIVVERRERLLGGDPASAVVPSTTDVATAEDASGAKLGKWLPFIALLVLVSGGAYAALAVFAGEREAGTLETLLVQPVPNESIAAGKFLAVFVAGMATLVVNLGSLLACVAFGIGDIDAIAGGEFTLARLAWIGLELPAALLLTAVLCVVCGGAKTFREGQMLIFPITLAVIVPTAIVLRPEAELTAIWALIPFAGSALGLRDGLEGDLSLPLAALVTASHLGWTWLALRRLAGVLDAEKLLGGDAKAESRMRQAGGRHAKAWGFAVVMAIYLVAGWVQRKDMEVGLWFTFWVMLPAFAIAIAWLRPRDEGEPRALGRELGLTAPDPLAFVGAVLCVPALIRGARPLLEWQQKALPMPGGGEMLGDPFSALATWQIVFFFAISPAIMEELVFRGSLLSSMKRDWRWPRILAWQALYFAFAHMLVYRLMPTAILGAILAAITLRAGSVLPAIVVHALYNLLTVGGGLAELDPESSLGSALAFTQSGWWKHMTWAAIPGIALLAAARPAPPRSP